MLIQYLNEGVFQSAVLEMQHDTRSVVKFCYLHGWQSEVAICLAENMLNHVADL